MRLLIGVSGGIAAYKALETARLAVRAGHSVRVIQTPNSERFVGRASFEGICGAPVLSSEFEADPSRGAFPGEAPPLHAPITHLALMERAEAYLIAPASANTLAKLASGAADNLVTAAALAASCPVVVAPAMNSRMYMHAATQANLRTLEQRGVTVIAPGEGALASHGEHGIGRLAEPAEILAALEMLVRPVGDWVGTRVLVTAGGTREPLDSVRFLGNRSSGAMGLALATAALRRGASVTVILANVSLAPPDGARVVRVSTAAELAAACASEFSGCDVLLMAAAVADFRPVSPVSGKLKKNDPQAPMRIDLEATADVLASLAAARREGQLVVGFAAEHGEGGLLHARDKLHRKRLDAIVLNDISRSDIGFESEANEVVILDREGVERVVPRASKADIADAILGHVAGLAERPREPSGASLN